MFYQGVGGIINALAVSVGDSNRPLKSLRDVTEASIKVLMF